MYRRASEISSSCRFRIVTPRRGKRRAIRVPAVPVPLPPFGSAGDRQVDQLGNEIRDALDHRRPVLEHLRRAAETAAGMDGLRAPVFQREQRRDSTSIVPVPRLCQSPHHGRHAVEPSPGRGHALDFDLWHGGGMRGGRGRPGLLPALCAAVALAACSTGGSEVANSSPVTSPSASAVTSDRATTASSLTAAPPPGSATSTPSQVSSVAPIPVSPIPEGPAAPSTATTAAPPAAPTTDATTEAGPGATAASGFTSSIAGIDDALAARMSSSWRPGCPVPLTDLRYLTVTYRGFDGVDHLGELVVAASAAPDVVQVFHRLYDNGFPLASLRLVGDFGGSDDQSMDADNSSAFNCRAVTG